MIGLALGWLKANPLKALCGLLTLLLALQTWRLGGAQEAKGAAEAVARQNADALELADQANATNLDVIESQGEQLRVCVAQREADAVESAKALGEVQAQAAALEERLDTMDRERAEDYANDESYRAWADGVVHPAAAERVRRAAEGAHGDRDRGGAGGGAGVPPARSRADRAGADPDPPG